MIGCFNHWPFNCITNKTIDSTLCKTKNNEFCDRRSNFVNYPSRYNSFCIILSPPKNIAIFVRWKSFDKFSQKKIKNQQNVNQEKSKILFPVPKFFYQSPPTCFLSPKPPSLTDTHTQKQTHLFITHKPPVPPRNSSYTVA